MVSILNGDETISLEDLDEMYYKTRMLGDLMIESEDYRRAEPYLFIALKIEELEGHDNDPNLMIDLAEAIYCNIDPKAYKPAPLFNDDPKYKKVSEIKAFLKKKEKVMVILQPFTGEYNDNNFTQEERLDVAKDILYNVIAEDPRNVDALQLLAEIFMEYAGQYVRLAEKAYKRPIRNFAKTDINYVSYQYEEARRHALESAVYEHDDEEEDMDFSLYAEASRQFAVFLAEAGEIDRSMVIFQDLLEKNTDPIAVRDSLVAAMMPSIVMWKDIRNESLENHRKYVGLRDTAKRFLEEIINYVDYQMAEPPNSEDLLMYIAAHYNKGVILLWEGGIEEAQDACEIIRGINHEDAWDWADDLEQHIEYQKVKDRNNPSKS